MQAQGHHEPLKRNLALRTIVRRAVPAPTFVWVPDV